jgi:hypothetical protein
VTPVVGFFLDAGETFQKLVCSRRNESGIVRMEKNKGNTAVLQTVS